MCARAPGRAVTAACASSPSLASSAAGVGKKVLIGDFQEGVHRQFWTQRARASRHIWARVHRKENNNTEIESDFSRDNGRSISRGQA